MKTNVKSMAIALFTLTTVIYGCKKEPLLPMQSKDDVKLTQTDQIPNIVHGKWKIISYEDGSTFRPTPISLLYGYVLKFNTDNVVIGTLGDRSIAGKWTYFVDSRFLRFVVIDFGFKPLTLINNKWLILKESEKEIVLRGMKDGKPVYLGIEQVERVINEVGTNDRPASGLIVHELPK